MKARTSGVSLWRAQCSLASRSLYQSRLVSQNASWYSTAPSSEKAKHAEPAQAALPVDSRVTGVERLEALGLAERWAGETILTGPFGTKDNPVVVHSYFNSRIVGCQGGPGDLAHDLLWHEVRREKPLVCLECGQFFVLKPNPLKERTEEIIRELHSAHHDIHAHDDHAHDEKEGGHKH